MSLSPGTRLDRYQITALKGTHRHLQRGFLYHEGSILGYAKGDDRILGRDGSSIPDEPAGHI
jgi:hypothetical protein